jgi:hypothetical protein
VGPGPDPAADWFFPLAAAIGAEELSDRVRIQAAAAARTLESRLGAASLMHGAGEWLREWAVSAAGNELAAQMIAATIAADHYQARLVCPRSYGRRLRGQAWRTYAARRAAQVLNLLPDVLLRWSVLERIPVNWVMKETIFAQMRARFEQEGYRLAVEGQLASPFPGGANWVSAECAPESGLLAKGDAGAIRAAVIFWPERAVPVIVAVATDGRSTAYAPGLDGNGLVIEWLEANAPVGVLLLPPPADPPAGWLMARVAPAELTACAI